jgi:translocation and assembly module TamB
VKAERVRAARTLERVSLALVTGPERDFTASVKVGAPALSLDAAGRWTPRLDGVTLARFELAYPEARWRLVRPASVRFGEGRLALDELALEAGAQRIAARVHTGPHRLAAQLSISDLDLARLPRALLPPDLVLAGKLDLDAEVAGSAERPRGRAKVSLEEGRFRKLDHLALELEARHDGRRVSGTLAARAAAARANARFDLPAAWPPPEAAPVALDLAVSPFDLPAMIAAATGRAPAGLRGTASLSVKLAGTAGRPTADAQAQVRGLVLRGQTLGDGQVSLALQAPGRGVDAHVLVRAFGGQGDLRMRAPVALGRLPRLRPEALLKVPVTLVGTVDRLPLRPLAMLARSEAVNAGTVTARIDLRGTAHAPLGSVRLDVAGVAGQRFPPTDAHLQLTAEEQSARATLRVARRGQSLLALDASVRAPASRLVQGDLPALASAPLEVKGRFGPVVLKRNDIPPPTLRDRGRTLSGRVQADLRLEGTLRAPRLTVAASAEDARFDDRPLGRADLKVTYENARPTLALVMSAIDGGRFELRGTAIADLSYPRVLRDFEPRQIPITADLQARSFDLGALSGIVDEVRVVGGKLTADAKLRGKAGAPAVDGRIEWREGRLAMLDFGSYERIHLLAHGNGREVVLEDLTARGGRGEAKLTGQATRAGDAYKITSKARLRSFPVFAGGQPVATVSLDAGATGTASADRIALNADISEAHFVLPESNRKRLQALPRPSDVVLFDGDRPLNRDQAKKLKKLLQERAAEATVDAEAARKAAAAIKPEKPGRRVRLTVEAPRNLWIEGPDVHLEIGLGPGFIVTMTDEPRVFGTVQVRRGRVEILGKRFDVDPSSTVRLTGPTDRPELAIKAVHDARTAGIQIQVRIEGPLDHLDLKLESPNNPQYGDTELLTVLATGHLPEDRGGNTATPTERAASLLGGVLASQMQKALARRLPLDVLTIEPGQGLSGTRLEAGTYLTEDLYVAYVGRIGADPFRRENRNEVQLEYQLTRRWSFEGTYGDARRGSADLVWTKSY